MSKSEKRYTVILSATEEGLKTEGFSRWVKKNVRKAVVFCAIILFLMVPVIMWNTIYTHILAIGDTVLFAVLYFRTWSKTGKEFFDKIKDLPEPIDLREK
jgi:hypothetical protein